MNLLSDLFKKFGLFLFFIFLEIISISMIVKDNNFHESAFQKLKLDVNGFIFNRISEYEKFITSPKELEKAHLTNVKLKEQILNLQNPIVSIDSVAKNKDSLLIENQINYELIPTRIIKNTTNKRKNYITINKGARDGVFKDMGIISDKGVIGVVISTSQGFAKATSILNPSQPINARVKRSNYFGSLKWGDGGKNPKVAQLNEIPKYIKINIGDTIETDGKSHRFPEGIAIGSVKKVQTNEEKGYLDIDVHLFEDFSNVTTAYVVKNLQKEELDSLENSIKIIDYE